MPERSLTKAFSDENIIFSFRQTVLSLWGELGLGRVGAPSKIVVNFAELTGLFIIRVPMPTLPQSLSALSSIIDISSRAVTVRVIHISGRLKNSARETCERLLLWRNTLPPEFAIPRKVQLDAQLRASLETLQSLPSYL